MTLAGVHKRYGSRVHLRRARLPGPAPRALVRDGRQRRRQVDAAQAGGRRAPSRIAGTVTLGASVKMGYFAQHAMDLLDGERTVFESLEECVSAGRPWARCARWRAASASPATTSRSGAGCCRAARRRGW
ncbi:MAG: hypothetical protein MZV49_15020 [Rhodopseudomonas palustris]|nr:hypothetical protein [Rhodopseudomonas palustris]